MTTMDSSERYIPQIPHDNTPYAKDDGDENELAENILKRQHYATHRAKHTLMRENSSAYNNNEIKKVFDYEMTPFEIFKRGFYKRYFSKQPLLAMARRFGTMPDHINNDNTTFGKPTEKSNIRALISPNKSVAQVDQEFYANHERSLMTHRRYLPSERLRRNYNANFNDKQVFGKPSIIANQENAVRHIHSHADNNALSSAQMYGILKFPFYKQTGARCAQNIEANNAECVPIDCSQDVRHVIEYVQQLREQFEQDPSAALTFAKLQQRFNEYSYDYLGWQHLFNHCRNLSLELDEQKIKHALVYYKLIRGTFNDCGYVCNYKRFLNLLNPNFQLPQPQQPPEAVRHARHTNPIVHKKLKPPPALDSTYREMCAQRANAAYTKPAIRQEWQRNRKFDEIAKRYGLKYNDYAQPRTKEQLERIFRQVLENDPESFEHYWQQAYDKFQPPNQLLSVNNMREVIKGKLFFNTL